MLGWFVLLAMRERGVNLLYTLLLHTHSRVPVVVILVVGAWTPAQPSTSNRDKILALAAKNRAADLEADGPTLEFLFQAGDVGHGRNSEGACG
jgi:hypothetical protein